MSPRDRLFRVFHALCSKRFPGDSDDQRVARLNWLHMLFGRTFASSKDLSDEQLKRAVEQLLKEVPLEIAKRYRIPSRKSKVIEMRPAGAPHAATKPQVWKIGHVCQYLGWHTAQHRLAAFLEDRYRVRHPDQLTARQAGEVIESLIRIAARADLKSQIGPDHHVSAPELRQAASLLKDRLRTWSPPAANE